MEETFVAHREGRPTTRASAPAPEPHRRTEIRVESTKGVKVFALRADADRHIRELERSGIPVLAFQMRIVGAWRSIVQ